MSRFSLTITADSPAELAELLTLAARDLIGSSAPVRGQLSMPLGDPPAATPLQRTSSGVPLCPRGHGEMVLRSPRAGQSWPPFYSCALGRDTCGERAEIGV